MLNGGSVIQKKKRKIGKGEYYFVVMLNRMVRMGFVEKEFFE